MNDPENPETRVDGPRDPESLDEGPLGSWLEDARKTYLDVGYERRVLTATSNGSLTRRPGLGTLAGWAAAATVLLLAALAGWSGLVERRAADPATAGLAATEDTSAYAGDVEGDRHEPSDISTSELAGTSVTVATNDPDEIEQPSSGLASGPPQLPAKAPRFDTSRPKRPGRLSTLPLPQAPARPRAWSATDALAQARRAVSAEIANRESPRDAVNTRINEGQGA